MQIENVYEAAVDRAREKLIAATEAARVARAQGAPAAEIARLDGEDRAAYNAFNAIVRENPRRA